MKKIILILLSSIFIFSCEEVVTLDFESDDKPNLVIDARIERIIDLDEVELTKDVVIVELSLTTDVYSESSAYVNDAEVTITDVTNNIEYSLVYDESGQYSIFESSGFQIQNDIEYKLSITYENEIYEASQVLIPSSPIEYLFQFKDTNAFKDPEDVAIKIVYKDQLGEGDFYVISINNMNFVTTEDTFIIDGDSFNFDYFYEDPPYNELVVYIYGSDENLNTYVDGVTFLSEGGNNGPFSTVPYELRGNIVNTTNLNNYSYGYFRVNEVYKKSITLVDNENAPTIKEIENIIKEDQQSN